MLSGDAGRSCIAVSISFLKKTIVVVKRRPRMSITFPVGALSDFQKTVCRQPISLISRCKTCRTSPIGCRNCVGHLRLAGSNCRRVGETSDTRRPNHKQSTCNRQRPNDSPLKFRWVASPGSGLMLLMTFVEFVRSPLLCFRTSGTNREPLPARRVSADHRAARSAYGRHAALWYDPVRHSTLRSVPS